MILAMCEQYADSLQRVWNLLRDLSGPLPWCCRSIGFSRDILNWTRISDEPPSLPYSVSDVTKAWLLANLTSFLVCLKAVSPKTSGLCVVPQQYKLHTVIPQNIVFYWNWLLSEKWINLDYKNIRIRMFNSTHGPSGHDRTSSKCFRTSLHMFDVNN